MKDPFEKHERRRKPERARDEIDEEFAFHLDASARDARAAGLDAQSAQAKAGADFGDVSTYRDACLRVAHPWRTLMGKKQTGKWSLAATCLAIGVIAGVLIPEALDDFRSDYTPREWQRVGAFEGLVWQNDLPIVLVDNRWYVLDAINGRQIESFMEATEARFGDRTRKRFKEDLYEVLQALDEPTDAIDATLRDPVSGAVVEKPGLELTQEKRNNAYGEGWRSQPDVPPVPEVPMAGDIPAYRFFC